MTERAEPAAATSSGFHGKLPARGDFVSYNLPLGFLKRWDTWLGAGLKRGAESRGAGWASAMAGAPQWRFALTSELGGGQAIAGTMIPSFDRVGRPFPLTLATVLAPGADIAAVPVTGLGWFSRAELLARQALDQGATLDLTAFIAAVRSLCSPPAQLELPASGRFGWRIELESGALPVAAYPALIRELVRSCPRRFSLWWTLGTSVMAPMLLVCDRLPDADAFPALFDGHGIDGPAAQSGWCDLANLETEAADQPVRSV